MTGEERSSKKKFAIIRVVITLVFLAILSYIAFTFISGRGFNFDWITGLIFPNEQVEVADELSFNVGRGRVFADLDDSVAAAGSLGIQVINLDGTEVLRESFTMNSPAIISRNGRAVAFDIGGTEARIFDNNEIITSVTANGPIISASINPEGWFTIDSQEGEGYRGTTSVYNENGSLIYRVSLSSGYILSSAISFDNMSLAILNLTDFGSRITFYHGLDKESDDGSFEYDDDLILDIRFLDSGDLLAITTESIMLIDQHELFRNTIFNFSDMRIGGYAISDDFIALQLLDFGIGHRGKLVLIDIEGNISGERITDRELVSMSLRDDILSVMLGDGLILLNRNLNIISLSGDIPSAAGVSHILALRDGLTLIAGDRFAIIVK